MFSFIRNLFSRQQWYPLSRVPEGFFTPPRTPGAITSPEQALTLAPFWAAVRLYATQIGSFPLVTYKRTGDGGKVRAEAHPAYNLLLSRPNPAQSRAVFWQFVVKELWLHGNAFVLVRWKGNNNVHALYPVPANAVDQVWVDDDWNKAYRIRLSDGPEVFTDADVLHFMGFSRDGLQGEPLWRYAGESLGLHRQVLESANAFFSNAARPSIYVRYPGKLTPEALANLKAGFKDDYQGTLNTGKVPVVEQGGEISQLNTTTAEDMQLVQGLGASVGDIGRWTALSPIQLGDFSAAHYNSLSADNTFLYQRSLRPLLDMIEQELNHKLFVDGTTFAEFDTDEVLRGDPLSTAQLANVGIQGGWLLRSEAREWFGLPPEPGLDTPTVPLNMGGQPGQQTPPTITTPTPQEQDATPAPQTAV
jgi:HK97 family phage portal protein